MISRELSLRYEFYVDLIVGNPYQKCLATGEQRDRAERAARVLGSEAAIPGRLSPCDGRRLPPAAVPLLRTPRGGIPRDHQRAGLSAGACRVFVEKTSSVKNKASLMENPRLLEKIAFMRDPLFLVLFHSKTFFVEGTFLLSLIHI